MSRSYRYGLSADFLGRGKKTRGETPLKKEKKNTYEVLGIRIGLKGCVESIAEEILENIQNEDFGFKIFICKYIYICVYMHIAYI